MCYHLMTLLLQMQMLCEENSPKTLLIALCSKGRENWFSYLLNLCLLCIMLGLTCSWSGPKPGVAAAAAAMVVGIS